MRRLPVFSAAALAAVAIAAVGCGSSSNSGSTTGSASSGASSSGSASSGGAYGGGGAMTTPSTTTTAATVKTAKTPLGTILVDSSGRTLYLFERDTTSKSTCDGACAAAWPPLTTSGSPKAAGQATSGMLGTTKRSDGTTEVTYAGHPLYLYAGDSAAGQTNGQGLNQFGAAWDTMHPNGTKVEGSGS